MKPALQITGLSKKYFKGDRQPYINLRDTIINIATSPRSIFSPKIEVSKLGHNEFWALKDINLTVNPGEILGIIGSNSAGKSTLLKILSRITFPSTGQISLNGRIASLLEVGTGFHLELTGRENIFLNGAILGMSRQEVKRKFNEIVEFSGVSKFLDTPVKHYSSGMRVRLGFAVAAHLDSEILLIDEVLAVGDAAFQQKSLGKMNDITKSEGRTIIFISHDMGAIQNLCRRCVLLEDGKIKKIGQTQNIIKYYLNSKNGFRPIHHFPTIKAKKMQIRKIKVLNHHNQSSAQIEAYKPFSVEVDYDINEIIPGAHLGLSLNDQKGNYVFFSSDMDNNQHLLIDKKLGSHKAIFRFPANEHLSLNLGTHYLRLSLGIPDNITYDQVDNLKINIHDSVERKQLIRNGSRPGIFLVDTKWEHLPAR